MVTDVDITSWFNHTLQSGSGTGVRAVPFLFAEGTRACLFISFVRALIPSTQ